MTRTSKTTYRSRLVGRACVAWLTYALASSAAAFDAAYSERWGPDVGTPFPQFEVLDQAKTERTFVSLTGDRGLLLFFNRSADW